MDIRVLKSLTTCALYPYLKDGTDAQVESVNGAESPETVAASVLDVPYEGRDFFAIGFALALECAARIESDPLRSPDLSASLREAQQLVSGARLMAVRHVADAFLVPNQRDAVIAEAEAIIERTKALA